MATRDWVELHKTIDPDIFDGIVEFQTRDIAPEYPPSGRVSALETTNRVDGPWAGRQYVRNTDSWQDAPPPPPDPGPTPDQQRRIDLLAIDATEKTDEDALLAKAPSSWTATDRASAQQMLLRKAEINRLK